MIVGIDLGTTNSAISYFADGEAKLIPNALGDFLTPSAVSLDDDGALLVGMAARDRQSTHPRRTATSFKRHMGTRKIYKLGARTFYAEDLSAMVLSSLKRDAERVIGEPVTEAVITVPAYFNNEQRKATSRAGQLAGLTVSRLVNEPTAAALGFGIHERDDREPFLVFDLGGGTFDISIVEKFSGIIEVRASAGDTQLGGDDFNDAVLKLAMEAIDPERQLDRLGDPELFAQICRAAAERTRRELSISASAPFSITWNGKSYHTTISDAAFEEAAADLIKRLREPVLRSLRDSGLTGDALSEVILVGGATRMPVVRRAAARMFGRFPDHRVHPDHAVALGAGVQAGLLEKNAALDEIRLTDVCPFTLGIATASSNRRGQLSTGIFSPIIERNTVIPASRSEVFGTMRDNQTQIDVRVYQGEARHVDDNVFIGQMEVEVPPRPAGEVYVDVRFSYDSSGLLEVDVTIPMTRKNYQAVLSNGYDDPTPAQLAERREMLAKLKVPPREQAENAALIARAERCYEHFLGDDRQMIGALIQHFDDVIAGQDPAKIEAVRAEIHRELDRLEGERLL